jgi:hypothetical protein
MRHDQELDFKMSSLQKAFSGWRPKADLQVPSKHNICIQYLSADFRLEKMATKTHFETNTCQ